MSKTLGTPKEMQEYIVEIFKKYKLDWITLNFPIVQMQNWAISTSNRLKIKGRILSEKISELFWSVGNFQLSLGYSLWCLEYCKYPKGLSGTAFSETEIPNAIDLPELHFWYHLHNSKECLYRCWERITLILQAACYGNVKEKLYFNGLIIKLKADCKYSGNIKLAALSELEKTWNKVAQMRNKASHHESSPMKSMKIEGKESGLFGPNGEIILCVNYSYKNLKNEIQELMNNNLLCSIRTMKEFIDSIELDKR